jgi:ABC-type transport system involved in cytochrome c biogenesis permease component
MRAAGFGPLAIGASLLLGASVGGELLNPGAPELLTVSAKTGVPTQVMWEYILPLVLPVLIAGVKATQAVLQGGLAGAGDAIGVLAAFDVIFTVAGWLLFTYVVRD